MSIGILRPVSLLEVCNISLADFGTWSHHLRSTLHDLVRALLQKNIVLTCPAVSFCVRSLQIMGG
jgi:hypothetical protein